MSASDHFSSQADSYALYRPHYPAQLFQFLAALCPTHELSWDCASGNGQAASGLAAYFQTVIASDSSAAQINKARTQKNIYYCVASAEQSALAAASLDLIVVAQALHWFDINAFYTEARRILKPAGVLAVLCYQLPRINTAIDALVDTLYSNILGAYWPPQRAHIDNAYAEIVFPLEVIEVPAFQLEHDWTLQQFLGYLQSWSALVYFEKKHKQNPISLIDMELRRLWDNDNTQRTVRWPLHLRAGKFKRQIQ